MSFKLEQGLFNLDFTDYHAILGIPVDAEVKDIRKRYLNIARRLHPDSCKTENEADRQRAAELLSKLVNPSYEKLSNEKNYTEYCVLLRLKGQQALKQQDTVVLTGDAALRLAAASDLDTSYRAAIRELSEKQYDHLNHSLEVIGQISELNLVYLMRKEGKGESIGQPRTNAGAGSIGETRSPAAAANAQPKAPPPPPTRDSLIAAYIRRSQEFETKQDYPGAIRELRDALRLEPTNSTCHSRLGVIYFKTNQMTMAKIHFNKALELNPQDAVALEGKQRLEAPTSKKPVTGSNLKGQPSAKGKPDPKAKPGAKGKLNPKTGKPEDKGGGGLFGLFGGKKK
ncbi:MAG: tetratricopeptide repeat protein [Elainellaceae cyanobacterium]